jgi:peptidoglycan/LPS O-acetylase OafA/YrhL
MRGSADATSEGGVSMPTVSWHRNNFDLLRLVAAAQVVWFHGTLLLGLSAPEPVHRIMSAFPGVPMFFVLSGFLVASSLDRLRDWRRYAVARVLRIYPALWACFAFTVLVLGLLGFLTKDLATSWRLPAWFFMQLSVAHTTPDAFRDFGTGDVNSSLWTISVELSFYVFLPVLFAVIRRLDRLRGDLLILAMMVPSIVIYTIVRSGPESGEHGLTLMYVLTVTLPAYLWMFLLGTLAYRNLDRIWPWFAGKGAYWLVGYVAAATTLLWPGYEGKTDLLADIAAILGMLLLAGTVLGLAFTCRGAAERTLHHNDISYGLYLYHWLLLQIVLDQQAAPYSYGTFAMVVVADVALASGSWFLLERPAKRRRAAFERRLGVLRPVAVAD